MSKLTIAAGALAALGSFESQASRHLPRDADHAVSLVRPIYEALTASSQNEIRSRLEAATSPDWENCGTNDGCETREATITRWTGRISRVPDFRFEIREILVSGNRIIVRSEASGTPSGPFLGVDPQGRSFKIMTLDIHEIQNEKVVRTYHVEDWARAVRQLLGDPS
jgi:predicted ester cyclase